MRLARSHLAAASQHFQRLLDADNAGKALGTAGSWKKSEIDLGKTTFRRWNGHAIVSDERQFEAAAERCAVDRGDDRLGRLFEDFQELPKRGLDGRLAEFGDVCSREEGSAFADEYDGADFRIGNGLR